MHKYINYNALKNTYIMLFNFSAIILSLSIICFYLYLRLNKKVLFLVLSSSEITNYKSLFVYLFIFKLTLLIYLLVLICYNPAKSSNFLDKLKKILLYLQKYNIFFRAYVLVFDYLSPNYTIYLIKYAKGFVEYSTKKTCIIILFFSTLPRMLILLCLILETFYSKVLHYYFYSLLLLLLPLLYNVFIFILQDLGPRLLPEFKKFINLGKPEALSESMQKSLNHSTKNPKNLAAISITLKPEYDNMDLDDLLFNFYYPLLFLPGHLDVIFLPLYRKINLISLLIYYLSQALIFGYILFYSV